MAPNSGRTGTTELVEQEFLINVEDRGDREVIHVQGELDMFRAPELEAALASLNGYSKTAVIDLTGCTLLDSGGIHAIMRACAEREMSIVCPPGNVHRVLDIVAVGKVVRLHETLQDALAA